MINYAFIKAARRKTLRLAILTDDESTYSRRSAFPAENGLPNQIEGDILPPSLTTTWRDATKTNKENRKLHFFMTRLAISRSIARSRDCRLRRTEKFDAASPCRRPVFFKLRPQLNKRRDGLSVIRERRKISPLKCRAITRQCAWGNAKGGCCWNNWRVAGWIDDSCLRSLPLYDSRMPPRFCLSIDLTGYRLVTF